MAIIHIAAMVSRAISNFFSRYYMAIRKPDGTIYRPLGSLKQFDPTSPAHDLFNRWDAESIEFGGTPVFYFELFIPPIDKLYHEARNKVWSQHPIELFAAYDPIPSQSSLTTFGIDGPDQIVMNFNYRAVLDAIGHPPIVGSRIYTPHLRENWEIYDRKTGDYQKWGAVRLEVHCERFQESLTTGEGEVSQPRQDFDIN